jgi:hypothetical protein
VVTVPVLGFILVPVLGVVRGVVAGLGMICGIFPLPEVVGLVGEVVPLPGVVEVFGVVPDVEVGGT